MEFQSALDLLTSINLVLAIATPIAGELTAAGKALIGWIHGNGTDIKPFEEEITKFEGIISGGQTVDNSWREKNGLPAWQG